jgi:hypothetical protein
MKAMGRMIGVLILGYIGLMLGSNLYFYIINIVRNNKNPFFLVGVAYLCLFIVGAVIYVFILVDIIFKTHIAEKIIATLVTNVLWNLIKFAGVTLLLGYKSTVLGVSHGVEVIRKIFRGGL